MRTATPKILSLIVLLTAAAPAAADAPPTASIRLTVDNVLEGLWVNGEPVAVDPDRSANWTRAETVVVELHPGLNVVAIQARDQGVIAGVLAEIVVGDSAIVSGESWRCSTDPGDGWFLAGYDDRAWPAATVYATHPGGVWGTRVADVGGIDPDAAWIWSDTNVQDGSIDPVVHFRLTFEVALGWVAIPR